MKRLALSIFTLKRANSGRQHPSTIEGDEVDETISPDPEVTRSEDEITTDEPVRL